MKNLLNPYWALAVVVLPHFILFSLFASSYQIIKSLLTPENLSLWWKFGLGLSVITISSLFYAVFCLTNKRDLHTVFGLLALLAHGVFMWLFLINYEYIIPRDIPAWLLMQGDLLMLVYTFLMPACVYGLFLMVIHFTPDVYKANASIDFMLVFLIPFVCYILVSAVPLLGLGNGITAQIFQHIVIVLVVSMMVAFLFFLTRFFYVVAVRQDTFFRDARIVWQVLCFVCLPLLGLFLNNEQFHFVFGDFSQGYFYGIALCNGLLFCLPAFEHRYLRLLLFVLRSVGFVYIAYFFVVFLPFLPLSLPAMFVFGAGFLMLMPLVNFIVQAQILTEDYAYLRYHWNNLLLVPVFVGGLACLPTLFWVECAQDKYALKTALAYLYETDYEKPSPHINIASLRHALENVASTKNTRNNDFAEGQKGKTPYLSAFYRWYVLENMTLSDAKINHLSQVFLNTQLITNTRPANATPVQNVVLDSLWTETNYDKNRGEYVTWLHTKARNTTQMPNQEFATEITLPTGVWVGDYCLDIENRREHGILAEKKAVKWIYQQIVNVRRDPGFLELKDNNKLAWRIFPFMDSQVRTSGIQFLHREPLTFKLNNKKEIEIRTLPLNQEAKGDIIETTETDLGVYISPAGKAKLPLVTRPAQYYLIVDNGGETKGKTDAYLASLKKIGESLQSQKIEIVLMNYRETSFPMQGDWQARLRSRQAEGGFFADMAIRKILFHHSKQRPHYQPVIVLLSEQKDLPTVTPFGEPRPIEKWENTHIFFLPAPAQERAYPNAQKPLAYLPDNGEPSIVVKEPKPSIEKLTAHTQERSWASGLHLHIAEQMIEQYPSEMQARWLAVVQASFRTQIQGKATSFIALENEAQKEALLAKQKQTLKASHYLDTHDEETRRMDEPVWIWAVLLAGLGVWWYFRKP